jgi:hypothetical protein
MYYNRTLTDPFPKLIEKGGELRWLFDFVKNREDLDFLIGKNKSKQWISIYRGTTRILSVLKNGSNRTYRDAAEKYKNMAVNLFGSKTLTDNFQSDIEDLITKIDNDHLFDRYYKNKKEGYFQNVLSRKYGICGTEDDKFVIIDKESVIGYNNQKEKDKLLIPIQQQYKQLQRDISCHNPTRYGSDLSKKAIGNELDFLALDREGNILLIEYKHGANTSGIYLSPLQIGLYYDIFAMYPRKELEQAIDEMLEQKQKIGLINPLWVKPSQYKDIIPVLIISEYNYDKSTGKDKFNEILQFVRGKKGMSFLTNLQTYNFTTAGGLEVW